jgi:hypothetical protein
MALIITPTYTTVDQGAQIMIGTVTLTGNYGTASSNGDVFNVGSLFYQGLGIQANPANPIYLDFAETPAAGSVPSGYIPGYAPSPTSFNLGNFTLMNGLSQYTPGSAYNAAQLATSFTFFLFIPSV